MLLLRILCNDIIRALTLLVAFNDQILRYKIEDDFIDYGFSGADYLRRGKIEDDFTKDLLTPC